MSSTKIETNLDFRGNEAQNMVKHKLASAPSIPKEGQEYYNTSTHKAAYWNGYEWVEDILIATDEEVLTGTDETKAINPKQLKTALEEKQSALGYVPENSENKVISLTENSTNIQYPSAKAVYDELQLKATLQSPAFTGTVTVPTVSEGDNSTKAANTAFVTTAINNALKSGLSKEIYTNSLLEPVDGVCTWSINHTLSTSDILCTIKEVATGSEVLMSKQSVSSTEYRITFNAAASVGTNTYKAILIGV